MNYSNTFSKSTKITKIAIHFFEHAHSKIYSYLLCLHRLLVIGFFELVSDCTISFYIVYL